LTQGAKPFLGIAVAPLDQTVGVEGQHAAIGQSHLGRFEGKAAQAERRADGEVEEADGAADLRACRVADHARSVTAAICPLGMATAPE
jgi:hypothetical protein